MTVCTFLPSWWGLIIAIIVLALGSYAGVYHLQKKIQKRTMKILYCVFSIFLLLAATLFILVVTSTSSCAGIGKPRLVHDYDTPVTSRTEAEVIFASYLKSKYPEGISLKYLERGIEETEDSYLLYESGNMLLTLTKDGKLYRQFTGE